jgi:hypothetical protein
VYCPKCGAENDDNAFRCIGCQAIIQPIPPAAPTYPNEADDPVLRLLLPVGRSGWAIAAGYAGLFSVTLVLAPIAVVLAVIAIRHLGRNPKLFGMGRAVFGLVMGILGTLGLIGAVVVAVVWRT